MSADDVTPPELLDSLPYYDNDLDVHPHLRRKVEAEIARQSKPPVGVLHPKVPPPITLFNKNPLLAAELERVESHQGMSPLDTVRYQLPAPPSDAQTEDSWAAAVRNAKAQLEHQRIRHTNLSLLQTYGSNAWKINNYLLESSVTTLEKEVERLRERTVEVNRERKNAQTRAGAQLTSLETRWTELISNVLQIELANVALEAENKKLAEKEEKLTSLSNNLYNSAFTYVLPFPWAPGIPDQCQLRELVQTYFVYLGSPRLPSVGPPRDWRCAFFVHENTELGLPSLRRTMSGGSNFLLWCVKEAAYKALQPSIRLTWKQLSFLGDPALHGRKPVLQLHPNVNDGCMITKLHASVSHDGDYVIASVVGEHDDAVSGG